MIIEDPGYDEVALTRPVGPHLCNYRSCAVQNTLAEVICDHAGVPAAPQPSQGMP